MTDTVACKLQQAIAVHLHILAIGYLPPANQVTSAPALLTYVTRATARIVTVGTCVVWVYVLQGADANLPNNDGWTPLDLACELDKV